MRFRYLVQRRRFLTGIAIAAVILLMAAGRDGSARPGESAAEDTFWIPGIARAIAVRDGRATFRVPAPQPNSETLVIVSALSRSRGPFPIRLSTRPVTSASIPIVADDGPRDRPSRGVPLPSPPPEPIDLMPPVERTFSMMVREGDVASPGNYLPVRGILKGVGRRIQIYVSSEDADAVDRGLLNDLITSFDDRIHPLTSARFGAACDTDEDGRFTILLSSWLGQLGGGRHAVDGFVRVADLDSSVPAPFGNHCDMMYLNATLRAGPYTRAVVAHEYMHAVTYSQKCLRRARSGRAAPEEEGWLDEAIAHLAEDMHAFSTSNIDYRVSAFLSRPECYQLVVDDYFAADLFRSHGNRGSTYLFLRWCVDRYGPGLIPALVHSSRRGVANLEAATGSTFADLYRRWSLALYLSGMDPPGGMPAESDDGFRSIDMRSPHADWELAGPRCSHMRAGGPAEQWSTPGTSSHFFVVDGSSAGAIEVEVVGPPDAQIQVTALPLGADRPRMDLSLRTSSGPDGELRVQARIAERHGVAVRISALAWELLTPGPRPHAGGFRSGRLDMLGVASAFGTSAVPAGGEILSRPIHLTGVTRQTGPIVVKVLATDERGRRVSAWADLNSEADEPAKGALEVELDLADSRFSTPLWLPCRHQRMLQCWRSSNVRPRRHFAIPSARPDASGTPVTLLCKPVRPTTRVGRRSLAKTCGGLLVGKSADPRARQIFMPMCSCDCIFE